MGRIEIIHHWVTMAERDWASVKLLFEGKQYVHTLFFCHLVIEKLLKAHWVKDNDETNPPRIHDLEAICMQSDLDISVENLDLLRVMNAWNIEGRYQDFLDKFYRNTTASYTKLKVEQVDALRQWLLSELQNKE